jgi:hypothetical protein
MKLREKDCGGQSLLIELASSPGIVCAILREFRVDLAYLKIAPVALICLWMLRCF